MSAPAGAAGIQMYEGGADKPMVVSGNQLSPSIPSFRGFFLEGIGCHVAHLVLVFIFVLLILAACYFANGDILMVRSCVLPFSWNLPPVDTIQCNG